MSKLGNDLGEPNDVAGRDVFAALEDQLSLSGERCSVPESESAGGGGKLAGALRRLAALPFCQGIGGQHHCRFLERGHLLQNVRVRPLPDRLNAASNWVVRHVTPP